MTVDVGDGMLWLLAVLVVMGTLVQLVLNETNRRREAMAWLTKVFWVVIIVWVLSFVGVLIVASLLGLALSGV